jgi:predicted phage terminase large subunit-like protein
MQRLLPTPETVDQELARRRTNAGLAHDLAAVRQRCRSLAGFVREAWPVLMPEADKAYVHGWHVDLVCRHLEALTSGEFLARGMDNRLLINVPPSMGKSLVLCVLFPAWLWGPAGQPGHQFIATSFREENCRRDSGRFLKLVSSDWYQRLWGDRVQVTRGGDELIENAAGGVRRNVPFGSLTSAKADTLLIDDPHSVDTAESDADRTRATMRFRESVTTRLNDPVRSSIVVIMQRLHENDISGVILSLGMRYVHLMLPMRFELERACVTPFGCDPRTTDGELLFPERFPEAVVDRDEAAMAEHAVAGQHQQRPAPRGGLMFKRHWFGAVDAPPADCRFVRGWDLAGSVKKTSAFTAGVKVGHCQRERRWYVCDVVRDRVLNPETMIVNTAQRDGKSVEISLPQDPGSAGAIQARSLIGALVGYNATATPESGEKADRAIPAKAQAEAGNILLVRGPWNEAFLNELACLDETAIVLTAQGYKSISHVTVEDWVVTRFGWRRVLQSGCTGHKKLCEIGFSNGQRLRTTLDHLIFHPGYGFKRAEMFTVGESLLQFTGTPSFAGSRAVGHILPAALPAEISAFFCIAPFMRTRWGQSLLAVISTIEMVIRRTIALEIFNALPLPTIGRLGATALIENAFNAVRTLTHQHREINIAPRAAGEKLIQTFDCDGTSARSADIYSAPIIGTRNSAACLVRRRRIGGLMPTTSTSASYQNNASGVEKSSSLSFDSNNFAADVAVSSIHMLPGVHKVYNLRVHEVPEYVANGVLVHNCFPAGAYKDQVDAFSRAFSRFVMQPSVRIVAPIVVTAPLVIHGTNE